MCHLCHRRGCHRGHLRSLRQQGCVSGRCSNAVHLHLLVSYKEVFYHGRNDANIRNPSCSYAGFVDTTLYVYCSEIFPTHIRAKGMGWSISIFFLSTLPFLESSATGFATIGWKYYLLFIILPSINVILLWIFCPEVMSSKAFKFSRFGFQHARNQCTYTNTILYRLRVTHLKKSTLCSTMKWPST